MTDLDGSFLEALHGFEAVLARRQAPIVANLRPGLRPEAIVEALRDAGIEPASEMVTWFAWHDGAERDYSDGGSFYVGYPFCSLEQCLAWRSSPGGQLFTDLHEQLRGWPRDTMPLFAHDEDETIGHAVDLGKGYEIYLGCYEVPEYTNFGSLPRFVRLMTIAWEQGIIRYNADREELEHDQEQMDRLIATG